jgi:hypothetical protein
MDCVLQQHPESNEWTVCYSNIHEEMNRLHENSNIQEYMGCATRP